MSEDLITRRRKLGTAFHDEVWDGTYVAPPAPNVDHQDLVGKLCRVIATALPDRKLDKVLPGANVSERDDDWEHDYRVPDVVVVLAGGRAVNRGTHLQGGPDFLVEVMSPGDDTMAKLPYYARLGVREVLVVARDGRELTLFRLGRKRLSPVKPADLGGEPWLPSAVLPLAFRKAGTKSPRLEIRRTGGRPKTWAV